MPERCGAQIDAMVAGASSECRSEVVGEFRVHTIFVTNTVTKDNRQTLAGDRGDGI
jgi:hypothetical protein